MAWSRATISLSARCSEYDELYDYDRYAPLNLKESEAFYIWEQAQEIVLNAFDNFSPRDENGSAALL